MLVHRFLKHKPPAVQGLVTVAFHFDATNASAVATVCRRLDGIPLAIELVVPRLQVQSADQLASAVLDPVWQVRSDERHGSLGALANWSYQLLKPDEQAVFRRLGVFAGWFDADDAAAIGPATSTPAPRLLSALVEHSMLFQEQTPRGGRYRLIETLRAFALEQLEQLEDAGELESARLSHVDRIVWLVERVDMVPRQGPAGESTETASTQFGSAGRRNVLRR